MRIGIIGATGYTGFELVKLILKHKGLSLSVITSDSYAGKLFSDIYPSLKGICDMVLSDNDIDTVSSKCDAFFLCLPHKASMDTAKILYNKGKIVIDLSADFRIKNKELYEQTYEVSHSASDLLEKAVYGNSELFTKEIQMSSLIAVPGCYPTSIITPLYPLIETGLIENFSIIADSKSGVSGAGRKPSLVNSFCETNEDFKPYGIFSHRHNVEIDHILSRARDNSSVIFTPHLLPVNRGILSTIYAKTNANISKIKGCLKSKYKDRKLIRIKDDIPALKYVTNTSFIDMAVYQKDNNLIIISAIDNLLKGASAQGLQCLNIILNNNEWEGLI